MGIQVSEKEPQLIGVFSNEQDPELEQIRRMVSNMNQDLIDSGFEQHQYTVELQGEKAYIIHI